MSINQYHNNMLLEINTITQKLGAIIFVSAKLLSSILKTTASSSFLPSVFSSGTYVDFASTWQSSWGILLKSFSLFGVFSSIMLLLAVMLEFDRPVTSASDSSVCASSCSMFSKYYFSLCIFSIRIFKSFSVLNNFPHW